MGAVSTIHDARRAVAARRAELTAARIVTEATLARAKDARAETRLSSRAHALLGALAESRREAVRDRVERTVAAALRAVFGPKMRFRLKLEVKRGIMGAAPEIGYVPDAGGEPVWRAPSDVGGGVADVASFALRLSLLCMRRPRLRRVLIADEPFKHVSDAHLPLVADMLRKVADASGVQLVVVSHEHEVAAAADKVYRVVRRGGGSAIVEETV